MLINVLYLSWVRIQTSKVKGSCHYQAIPMDTAVQGLPGGLGLRLCASNEWDEDVTPGQEIKSTCLYPKNKLKKNSSESLCTLLSVFHGRLEEKIT